MYEHLPVTSMVSRPCSTSTPECQLWSLHRFHLVLLFLSLRLFFSLSVSVYGYTSGVCTHLYTCQPVCVDT